MRPWSMPGDAASSSSICSSDRSDSLCPFESKNLTPLYSGGLCDAEMTTPRSRASSATAGVGSTPPRMQSPPAETTPRANACSRARPRGRGARPARASGTRPRHRGHHRCRSTSVPREPELPLAELWRLAGLVEAGLLALHHARIAREETGALERSAKLGVDLD